MEEYNTFWEVAKYISPSLIVVGMVYVGSSLYKNRNDLGEDPESVGQERGSKIDLGSKLDN